MEAAWQQVGKVLAGNQKVRHSHFAMAATIVWNQQNFVPMQTAQAYAVPDGRRARAEADRRRRADRRLPRAGEHRAGGSDVEGDAAGAAPARTDREAHRLRRRTPRRATSSIG